MARGTNGSGQDRVVLRAYAIATSQLAYPSGHGPRVVAPAPADHGTLKPVGDEEPSTDRN
jgi:hypothetical protein